MEHNREIEALVSPNVEDLDLVVSVTKTIFVVAGKNRVRFFDDQTNFVTGSEAVKLIAV